jgi:Flp pilus assembly protein TadG
MKTVFDGFRRSRRGAVALMFALALFPLVGMVGLAIDFSFFAEARAQVQAAADAATAHAVRAATGTYALETSEGIPDATAQADAIAAGNQAGAEWFQSQLGQLPTASLAATGGACASGGNSNPCINTSYQAAPVGFSAKVTYIGTYPPFFDTIFQKPASATWGVDGASGATTAYQYVEVVMLLDTSASMLLGADQPDIVAMEDGSVCISPSAVSGDISGSKTATNLSLISGNKASAYTPNVLGYTSDDPGTAESLNIDQTVPNIANYTPAASYFATPPDLAMNGKCAKGFDGAYEPCAFACHTDSGTGTGSHDLYGLARGETTALGDPVKLRLDVVLSAAENVVSTSSRSACSSSITMPGRSCRGLRATRCRSRRPPICRARCRI